MGFFSKQSKPEVQVVESDQDSTSRENNDGVQTSDTKSSPKEEVASAVTMKFKDIWRYVKSLGATGLSIIGKSVFIALLISVGFVIGMISWGPLSLLKILLLIIATITLGVSVAIFFIAWNVLRFIDKETAPVLNTCSNFLSQKLNSAEILNLEKVFDSSKDYVIEKAPILAPVLAPVSFASFEKTVMKSSQIKNYSKVANKFVGGKIDDINNLFENINSIVSTISVVWHKPLGFMMKKSVFYSLLAIAVPVLMIIFVF